MPLVQHVRGHAAIRRYGGRCSIKEVMAILFFTSDSFGTGVPNGPFQSGSILKSRDPNGALGSCGQVGNPYGSGCCSCPIPSILISSRAISIDKGTCSFFNVVDGKYYKQQVLTATFTPDPENDPEFPIDCGPNNYTQTEIYSGGVPSCSYSLTTDPDPLGGTGAGCDKTETYSYSTEYTDVQFILDAGMVLSGMSYGAYSDAVGVSDSVTIASSVSGGSVNLVDGKYKFAHPVPPRGRTYDLTWLERFVDDSARTASTLTTGLGGDRDLKFTGNILLGSGGNAITVEYVDPGHDEPNGFVSVVGTAVKVTLAKSGSDFLLDASSVAGLINDDLRAKRLLGANTAPGSGGSGILAPMGATGLSGGTGTPPTDTVRTYSWDGSTPEDYDATDPTTWPFAEFEALHPAAPGTVFLTNQDMDCGAGPAPTGM